MAGKLMPNIFYNLKCDWSSVSCCWFALVAHPVRRPQHHELHLRWLHSTTQMSSSLWGGGQWLCQAGGHGLVPGHGHHQPQHSVSVLQIHTSGGCWSWWRLSCEDVQHVRDGSLHQLRLWQIRLPGNIGNTVWSGLFWEVEERFHRWHLTVTFSTTFSWWFSGMVYMIGLFIGSYIIGYAGDKFGRKKTMMISLLFLIIGGSLAGIMPYYSLYVV